MSNCCQDTVWMGLPSSVQRKSNSKRKPGEKAFSLYWFWPEGCMQHTSVFHGKYQQHTHWLLLLFNVYWIEKNWINFPEKLFAYCRHIFSFLCCNIKALPVPSSEMLSTDVTEKKNKFKTTFNSSWRFLYIVT